MSDPWNKASLKWNRIKTNKRRRTSHRSTQIYLQLRSNQPFQRKSSLIWLLFLSSQSTVRTQGSKHKRLDCRFCLFDSVMTWWINITKYNLLICETNNVRRLVSGQQDQACVVLISEGRREFETTAPTLHPSYTCEKFHCKQLLQCLRVPHKQETVANMSASVRWKQAGE